MNEKPFRNSKYSQWLWFLEPLQIGTGIIHAKPEHKMQSGRVLIIGCKLQNTYQQSLLEHPSAEISHLSSAPSWYSKRFHPMEITIWYSHFFPRVKNIQSTTTNVYDQYSQIMEMSNKYQSQKQCHRWCDEGFQIKWFFFTYNKSPSFPYFPTWASLLHSGLWFKVHWSPKTYKDKWFLMEKLESALITV